MKIKKAFTFIINLKLSILYNLYLNIKFYDNIDYIILILNVLIFLDPNNKYLCLIFKVCSLSILDLLKFIFKY